jgi:hypothetical protein
MLKAEIGKLETEDRRQKTGVRGQKAEGMGIHGDNRRKWAGRLQPRRGFVPNHWQQRM